MIKAEKYFNSVLERLIFSKKIKTFNLIKKKITGNEIYFRIKFFFIDKSFLEVVNYLGFNSRIKMIRYSYNWFNKNLISPWDNAEHHKELRNFPYHKHIGKEQVVADKKRFIFEILEYIEKKINP